MHRHLSGNPHHPTSSAKTLRSLSSTTTINLRTPTLAQTVDIAQMQEDKEKEVQSKYAIVGEGEKQEILERERKAAGTIQRTYRGHRARRQLQGLSLDPSSRWIEAVREARYRNLTTPRSKTAGPPPSTHDGSSSPLSPQGGIHSVSSDARQNWRRVGGIAKRAHHADAPNSSSSSLSSTNELRDNHHSREPHRRKAEKEQWQGKAMSLPYFLELVDRKHRYGSNLRAYHAEWRASPTNENFFYWLDYGEGLKFALPRCSRERLEREQVRYLSREERLYYLVKVDGQGKLCWAKNGNRIDTTDDWRDSVHGIVPRDNPTPMYREEEIAKLGKIIAEQRGVTEATNVSDHHCSDSDEADHVESSSKLSSSSEADKRYPEPPELRHASGPAKILQISPNVIMNHLLRKSVRKKKNVWIFVFDTSDNLYIGLKQSGQFQHSSFLHGSRISAAGQIRLKRGQLRTLAPLSGHYRPPAEAFRHFIASLKEQGVDMSRVSISRSYAVLVGLEGYIATKETIGKASGKVKEGFEMAVMPGKVKERKKREEDRSQSARLEREWQEREKKNKESSVSKLLKDLKGLASVDGDRASHDREHTHQNSRGLDNQRSSFATGEGGDRPHG